MSETRSRAPRFPLYQSSRNMALSLILMVMFMMQIGMLSETVGVEELSQLALAFEITAYMILLFGVLPLLRWAVTTGMHYVVQRYNRGEAA